MPAITSTAPGKIILFGEHAVVYGRPAIAVPLGQVRARAVIKAEPRSAPGSVRVQAPQVDLDAELTEMAADHPLGKALRLVLEELDIARPPACSIRITSTIPIAAGLGSGAAVSVAVIRAFSTFLGRTLPDERVSALAFEVEKTHHGTPSGIDNTVITYNRPVYFLREPGGSAVIAAFEPQEAFTVVIGDTGIPSPTAAAVGDLRRAWQEQPTYYETLFDAAGKIAEAARHAIETGQTTALGPLMDENHTLLQQMGVSTDELDRLVDAAREAGVLGAKMSGGGRGGNMIALVEPADAERIAARLREAGAVHTLISTVGG